MWLIRGAVQLNSNGSMSLCELLAKTSTTERWKAAPSSVSWFDLSLHSLTVEVISEHTIGRDYKSFLWWCIAFFPLNSCPQHFETKLACFILLITHGWVDVWVRDSLQLLFRRTEILCSLLKLDSLATYRLGTLLLAITACRAATECYKSQLKWIFSCTSACIWNAEIYSIT